METFRLQSLAKNWVPEIGIAEYDVDVGWI